MWYVFLNIKPANAHPKYTVVAGFIQALRFHVLGVFVFWLKNKKCKLFGYVHRPE